MFNLRHVCRPASVIVVAGAVLVVGCSDSSNDETVFGASVQVGGGTARTYVVSSGGEPVEMGIRLSELSITGLPAVGTVFLIPLPVQAAVAPYQHMTLNWNPAGHPPAAFSVPHFDAHFYIISEAERHAISPADAQFATKAANTPGAEFIPVGYGRDPGAVPDMGTHWTDPTAPEFTGQTFTKTFVYGSWNGAFTFYEPMFTKAFLESKPAVAVAALKLPSKYSTPGLYPTSYKVGYDSNSKEWVIALSGLVSR
jgi:hypothetical protein